MNRCIDFRDEHEAGDYWKKSGGFVEISSVNWRLKNRITFLEKNANFLLDKVHKLWNKSRHNYLIVYGIKETEDDNNETLETCVKNNIFGDILSTWITGLERIHRLGHKAANKTRQVILKLSDERDKNAIWKNCRRFEGSEFSVSEDFSSKVQQIRKKLQETAKELENKGDKVVLSFDRIKINGQVFPWDDPANASVPLYPTTRKKKSDWHPVRNPPHFQTITRSKTEVWASW